MFKKNKHLNSCITDHSVIELGQLYNYSCLVRVFKYNACGCCDNFSDRFVSFKYYNFFVYIVVTL